MNKVDYELIGLLNDKAREIEDKNIISQQDVLSIESMVGSNIITKRHKLSKFTIRPTNFNVNLAVESIREALADYNDLFRNVHGIEKMDAITKCIKIMGNWNISSLLRDKFIGYPTKKVYNRNDLLVDMNKLDIQDFFNTILVRGKLRRAGYGDNQFAGLMFNKLIDDKKIECRMPYDYFIIMLKSQDFRKRLEKELSFHVKGSDSVVLNGSLVDFQDMTLNNGNFVLETIIVLAMIDLDILKLDELSNYIKSTESEEGSNFKRISTILNNMEVMALICDKLNQNVHHVIEYLNDHCSPMPEHNDRNSKPTMEKLPWMYKNILEIREIIASYQKEDFYPSSSVYCNFIMSIRCLLDTALEKEFSSKLL